MRSSTRSGRKRRRRAPRRSSRRTSRGCVARSARRRSSGAAPATPCGGRRNRRRAVRETRRRGDPRAALDLWRGPLFADVPRTQPLQVEADRLEEQRLRAIEDRIDRELDAGRHREVVPELQALVAANPLRERLVGQLMVALYGSGRQAEALEAYRRARHTLVDELGDRAGGAAARSSSVGSSNRIRRFSRPSSSPSRRGDRRELGCSPRSLSLSC